MTASPTRHIVRADALAWLAENPAPAGSSVITSTPDLSEVPGLDLGTWRRWSVSTARTVLDWTPDDGVAIFFQSDIRVDGTWVDKGYLVLRAIEELGAFLVWHKIVCRKPPGTPSFGRSTYSHMICASPGPRPPPRIATPDVLPDAGEMSWSKAMGVEACKLACRFLRDETATKIVVDPFCGNGTALAVANAYGFDAIGVDKSPRRCKVAKKLTVDVSED